MVAASALTYQEPIYCMLGVTPVEVFPQAQDPVPTNLVAFVPPLGSVWVAVETTVPYAVEKPEDRFVEYVTTFVRVPVNHVRSPATVSA